MLVQINPLSLPPAIDGLSEPSKVLGRLMKAWHVLMNEFELTGELGDESFMLKTSPGES